jgi:hypothetical protein
MSKAIQKMLSYKGCIPSTDMNSFHYSLYLKVAPPHELEKDIISEMTMRKMINESAL